MLLVHSVLPSFAQKVGTGLEGPCSDLTNALANVGVGSFGHCTRQSTANREGEGAVSKGR